MKKPHQKCNETHGKAHLEIGMSHSLSVAEDHRETIPILPVSPDLIEKIIKIILDIQNRTALYKFPPLAAALEKGRRPILTHKGKRAFYLFRKQYLKLVDWRAVEAVLRENKDMFKNGNEEKERIAPDGMTLTEFTKWARISRTNIAQNLVEVPPGPIDSLPVGKVPTRRIGKTRRVFKSDFLGTNESRECKNDHFAETFTDTTDKSTWDRQISDLRDRYNKRR